MNVDTTANLAATGTSIRIENEALLIERLQTFGLIEANGDGGWRLTECCQAGLAALGDDMQAPTHAGPAVVLPWRPRAL